MMTSTAAHRNAPRGAEYEAGRSDPGSKASRDHTFELTLGRMLQIVLHTVEANAFLFYATTLHDSRYRWLSVVVQCSPVESS